MTYNEIIKEIEYAIKNEEMSVVENRRLKIIVEILKGKA